MVLDRAQFKHLVRSENLRLLVEQVLWLQAVKHAIDGIGLRHRHVLLIEFGQVSFTARLTDGPSLLSKPLR